MSHSWPRRLPVNLIPPPQGLSTKMPLPSCETVMWSVIPFDQLTLTVSPAQLHLPVVPPLCTAVPSLWKVDSLSWRYHDHLPTMRPQDRPEAASFAAAGSFACDAGVSVPSLPEMDLFRLPMAPPMLPASARAGNGFANPANEAANTAIPIHLPHHIPIPNALRGIVPDKSRGWKVARGTLPIQARYCGLAAAVSRRAANAGSNEKAQASA